VPTAISLAGGGTPEADAPTSSAQVAPPVIVAESLSVEAIHLSEVSGPAAGGTLVRIFPKTVSRTSSIAPPPMTITCGRSCSTARLTTSSAAVTISSRKRWAAREPWRKARRKSRLRQARNSEEEKVRSTFSCGSSMISARAASSRGAPFPLADKSAAQDGTEKQS
jgi:hypothetical protein